LVNGFIVDNKKGYAGAKFLELLTYYGGCPLGQSESPPAGAACSRCPKMNSHIKSVSQDAWIPRTKPDVIINNINNFSGKCSLFLQDFFYCDFGLMV
jgi:hypothetical protein